MMTIIRAFTVYTLLFTTLLLGCAHQQNRSTQMNSESPVPEKKNTLAASRIEYSKDDNFIEYKDFFYNDNCQVIQEILYSKNGKIKETGFFEYTSGILTNSVISEEVIQ